MDILIVLLLWIPSMAWMYLRGYNLGAASVVHKLVKKGHLEFNPDGTIKPCIREPNG